MVKQTDNLPFNIFIVVETTGKEVPVKTHKTLEELNKDLSEGYDVIVIGKQVFQTKDIKEIKMPN